MVLIWLLHRTEKRTTEQEEKDSLMSTRRLFFVICWSFFFFGFFARWRWTFWLFYLIKCLFRLNFFTIVCDIKQKLHACKIISKTESNQKQVNVSQKKRYQISQKIRENIAKSKHSVNKFERNVFIHFMFCCFRSLLFLYYYSNNSNWGWLVCRDDDFGIYIDT